MTLHSMLHQQAQQRPHTVALVTADQPYTYADLAALTAQVAATWQARGIGAGVRVGLLMSNSVAMVACIHAALHLGAVMVLLNTRLTASELDYQLTLTECGFVVYDSQTSTTAQRITAPHTAIRVEGLLASTPQTALTDRTLSLDAPAAVVFTSGTSGQPKAVVLTVGSFYASAQASAERIGTQSDDNWLCVLPLYHVGGLSIVIRSAIYGTAFTLMSRFDVTQVADALMHGGITLASLVPTMLYRLIDQLAGTPPHLRLILIGGAAPSADLLEQAYAANLPISTTYGMSEAASQVATALPDLARRKVGTVGQPLPGTQVMIVDHDDNPVPAYTHGEILVHSATVMQGYLNNPEATAKTLRNGWLHTGDIGYVDDEGDLFVLQRRSDLIISGGENVYPAEVEAVLRSHPAVADALVVGLPDAEWGQRVAALLILQQTVSLEELKAYCADRLAGYKQPRHMLIVEQMPLTASDKVSRHAAVELLLQVFT